MVYIIVTTSSAFERYALYCNKEFELLKKMPVLWRVANDILA